LKSEIRNQKSKMSNIDPSIPVSDFRFTAAGRARDEAAQRGAVVVEARSWVGTPYHNCADIKGVGVDCGMLLVRVFVDTGLCPPFDPRPYPADWHLHRSEEKYLGFIFDRGSEVSEPQPGDVMVLRFGRCYSHGGIIANTKPLVIVHAYYQARRVVEEDIGHDGRISDPARKPRFFSFWAPAAGVGLTGGNERGAKI
jgi:cell wall-associated NlpC family hydrolase